VCLVARARWKLIDEFPARTGRVGLWLEGPDAAQGDSQNWFQQSHPRSPAFVAIEAIGFPLRICRKGKVDRGHKP